MTVTDTKIRDRKDLEAVKAPFLGEVPLHGNDKLSAIDKLKNLKNIKIKDINKKKEDKVSFLVHHGKRDAVNEAFRVCRTNLEFMNRGSSNHVIITTSFNPGSGKTFVTSNLGAALSIKGFKVLLVDGDLRHASLSSLVGSPKKGLSNYLSGEGIDINSVMVKVEEYDSLTILPVGTIPPNPSELVGSRQFAELIASLKGEYDYILIDCPPFNIVADTQIISEIADRTIFIVRSGMLDKVMIHEIEDIYSKGTLKNLSLLLNATEMSSGRGSYGYGYRYGYGGYHSYDYYSQKDK